MSCKGCSKQKEGQIICEAGHNQYSYPSSIPKCTLDDFPDKPWPFWLDETGKPRIIKLKSEGGGVIGFFRKKPVVIEAMQFDGTLASIESFSIPEVSQKLGTDTCQIPTLQGEITANKGDWIIKGVRGDFYPCKPEIFQSIYESVEQCKSNKNA